MIIILILIILVLVGYIIKLRNSNPELKKEIPKISREEKNKVEEQKKAFDNLMKYDYETALQKRDK